MNKPVKILLGIFTFLPMIAVIAFIVFGLYQFLSLLFSVEPINPFIFFPYLVYIIPVVLIYSTFYLLLGIFYIVHLLKNDQLDTEKKMLWIAVLVVFNALSMPIYWYFHIWIEEPDQEPVSCTLNLES